MMLKKIIIFLNEQEYEAFCIDAQKDLRPLKLHAQYLIHSELLRRGLINNDQALQMKKSKLKKIHNQLLDEYHPKESVKMSFDLVSSVKKNSQMNHYIESINFNVHTWPLLLNLARTYGWQPAGTLPGVINHDSELFPDVNPDDWDGGYLTNDYQVVTSEDAAALANALENALDDIPDDTSASKYIEIHSIEEAQTYLNITNNPIIKEFLLMSVTNGTVAGTSIPNIMLSPFEYFAGSKKQDVIAFISLCRQGAFYIT